MGKKVQFCQNPFDNRNYQDKYQNNPISPQKYFESTFGRFPRSMMLDFFLLIHENYQRINSSSIIYLMYYEITKMTIKSFKLKKHELLWENYNIMG